MSETEQAIERVRKYVEHHGDCSDHDVSILLAEHDRLKGELARLTTLRAGSEHDGKTWVVWWKKVKGEWLPYGVSQCWPTENTFWTPLPTPREKEDDHEPQE